MEVEKAKWREPYQGFFSVSFQSPTYWEERRCFKVSGDYLGSAINNSWKCYFSQEIILNGLQIASFLMILVEKRSKKGSVDTSSVGHTPLTQLSIFSLFNRY